MTELANVLPRLSLTSLCLGENRFGLEGLKLLCQSFVSTTPSLGTTTTAAATTATTIVATAEGRAWKVPLDILDLSENDLGPTGVHTLMKALADPAASHVLGSLRVLNLSGNKMGIEGAFLLARVMNDGGKYSGGKELKMSIKQAV